MLRQLAIFLHRLKVEHTKCVQWSYRNHKSFSQMLMVLAEIFAKMYFLPKSKRKCKEPITSDHVPSSFFHLVHRNWEFSKLLGATPPPPPPHSRKRYLCVKSISPEPFQNGKKPNEWPVVTTHMAKPMVKGGRGEGWTAGTATVCVWEREREKRKRLLTQRNWANVTWQCLVGKGIDAETPKNKSTLPPLL